MITTYMLFNPGEFNMAVNKPAYQSDHGTKNGISITVDGNTGSCTTGNIAWLAVDLGRMQHIDYIRLNIRKCNSSDCGLLLNVGIILLKTAFWNCLFEF